MKSTLKNLRTIVPVTLLLLAACGSSVVSAQTTVFYDNCNSIAGWTNTGGFFASGSNALLNTGAIYNWQSVDPIVPPDDHTIGGNCFYTNGNQPYVEALGQNYILYQLVSPVIDLTGYNNTRLEFWMQMRSETGNWDGGYVEWSHDGVTWTQLTNAQLCTTGNMLYDGNMSQNAASTPYYPYLRPAWFNFRTAWTRMLVNISAFDNVPHFQLRYTFHSDQLANDLGWTIDDIRIVSVAMPHVEGNNITIPDNDITPIVADGTDFGSVGLGLSVVHTFWIHNSGESPLNLTGTPIVTCTGAGFTILNQPASNIVPPGDSVSFDVQFNPSVTGIVNGVVTINNGDIYSSCAPPNPYNFAIRANGILINVPPYIVDPPADTIVCPNTGPILIPFEVGDSWQAPATLTLSATSSNPAVVPVANIVFGGAGANRDVTITPVTGTPGSSIITITVNDGQPLDPDSSFSFVVELADTIAPVAVCQNVQVQLDAAGNGTLAAADVDNGSTDNCAISSITISQTNFTCADVGTVVIDMTVEDLVGNITICQSSVDVLPAALQNSHTTTDFNGFQVSCAGGNDGEIAVQTSSGCTPYAYSWLHDPALTAATATALTAGNYEVTVTDAVGQTEVIQVTLTEPPAMADNSTTTNISCFGETDGVIELDATGGVMPYQFSQGPVITGLSAGNYNFTITDDNSCDLPVTFTIIEPDGVVISGKQDYFIFCGDEIQIPIDLTGGTGVFTYEWSNAGTLDCADCEDPNASPDKSTVYTVTVKDDRGCTENYSITVEVNCNVFVPNAFTPNDDGLNEEFQVKVGKCKEYEMRIYNRWGEEVFHSGSIDKPWRGYMNPTSLAPEGIYVYDIYLLMPNDEEINLRGMVNLIR